MKLINNLISKRLRKKIAKQDYSSYIADPHLPNSNEYGFWTPQDHIYYDEEDNVKLITEFLNNMSEEECIKALNDIGLSPYDMGDNDKILRTLSDYKSNIPNSWKSIANKLIKWYHTDIAALPDGEGSYLDEQEFIIMTFNFKMLPRCLNAIMEQVKPEAEKNDNFSFYDYQDVINHNMQLYLKWSPDLGLDWGVFYFDILEDAMLSVLKDEHLY